MVLKHVHTKECSWKDTYLHYLCLAAPSVEWFKVEDVGSYSGSVYAVGRYKGKILLYSGYYGSCSGCGAWGGGGEPVKFGDVLNSDSKLCKTVEEALIEFMKMTSNSYDKPDYDSFSDAIKEAGKNKKEGKG